MSFTTRCPACGTVFRVVADQLKISDGWVRCGHCSDVFDATIHLQAWSPPAAPVVAGTVTAMPPRAPEAAPPPPPPAPFPAIGPAAAASSPAVGPFGEPDLVLDLAPEPVPSTEARVEAPAFAAPPGPAPAAPAAAPIPVEPPAVEPPAVEPMADDDLRAWFGDGPLDAPAPAAASPAPVATPGTVAPVSSATPARNDAAAPASTPAAAVEALADDGPSSDFEAELQRFAQSTRGTLDVLPTLPATARPDLASDAATDAPAGGRVEADAAPETDDETAAVPGFVRQAQRRAFWTSPGVRIGLGLLALLLTGLLGAQWAVQHRHQLVAAHPPLRPAIEQSCAWLGCDLQPLRRIDDVEIESAELVRRLGNFYSFDFVLRNRSALEVALPALELTLTNIGDQAVARRVFLPQDWPDAPTALAPNGRVSVSLRLSLMLGDDAPTAGYRALVFYP